RGQAVDPAAHHAGQSIEEALTMRLDVVDGDGNGIADRELVAGDPTLESVRRMRGPSGEHRRQSGLAVEGPHAIEPGGHGQRVGADPGGRGLTRRLVALED